MGTPNLPISTHVRLDQLRRLKELLKAKDGLTAEQRAMAGQVFTSAALDVLRRQAIEEMVAAGYLDVEIKMTLAMPDSPYSILIEGLKPESINETTQKLIRRVRLDRKARGPEQFRDEFLQQQRRLIDAAWETLAEAGAAHRKPLLDAINERSQAIAEAENVRRVRAGRGSTRRSEEPEESEQPEGEESTPAGSEEVNPNWGEEFTPDESND